MSKKRPSATKTRSHASGDEPKTSTRARTPRDKDVASELGAAQAAWNAIIANVRESYGDVDADWKASKGSFGWMCVLRHKKRNLVYLVPEKQEILVGLALGERAVALALASELPQDMKKLISDAPKYAEGRGIRFRVSSVADASTVARLVVIKTTPK